MAEKVTINEKTNLKKFQSLPSPLVRESTISFLEVPLEIAVRIFDTFDNNLKMWNISYNIFEGKILVVFRLIFLHQIFFQLSFRLKDFIRLPKVPTRIKVLNKTDVIFLVHSPITFPHQIMMQRGQGLRELYVYLNITSEVDKH